MGYRDDKLNDYLDANATWRRTLRLHIETPELLRTGDNPGQRRRQKRLLDEARAQAKGTMRKLHRRAFRGEVSVECNIYAPTANEAPSAPKSVKRYLDLLEGIAYADDRQVGHLQVRRFAPDHPFRRQAEASGFDVGRSSRETPSVHLVVTPLRLYVADYDRVFNRYDDLTAHGSDVDSEAAAFFEDEPDEFEHDELADLYKERKQDANRHGLYSVDDPSFVETMRAFRERRISALEGNIVLRQRPNRDDKPGPDLAARDDALFAAHGLPPMDPLIRYELPGTFWLPPLLTAPRRQGERAWSDLARHSMELHRARWRMLPDVFDQPLVLDIAIHGAKTSTHDIDNVAHTVLRAFEELYCGDRRGTVVGYRVYRQASSERGVRVHLMTDRRLSQLDAAINESRELVLRNPPP